MKTSIKILIVDKRLTYIILYIFLFLLDFICKAQITNNTLLIKANVDSFEIVETGWTWKMKFSLNDTLAFGTDMHPNFVKIKTDIDSVWLPDYDILDAPNPKIYFIEIISPKGKQIIAYSRHQMINYFSQRYIRKSIGNVQYQIPTAYELANITYSLTKSSSMNVNRTFKNTAYYNRTQKYFSRFKNHPLINELEFNDDSLGLQNYLNFRENSFCYDIKKNKLIRNNKYYYVFGKIYSGDLNVYGKLYDSSKFEKLIPLLDDFITTSNFSNFLKKENKYYKQQIQRTKKLIPIKKMWIWLEKNFDTKYDSYKVVFSPLILGSHSTQNYTSFFGQTREKHSFKKYSETVLFVSGVEVIDSIKNISEKQKEACASAILFTEIDHNYCNPLSNNYLKIIDSAFLNREKWIKSNGDRYLYSEPINVFNEYITHALFILYCYDTYDKKDFDFIRLEREILMVRKRGYIKFKEFSDKLLQLYIERKPNQTVQDLYPSIIKWCTTIT